MKETEFNRRLREIQTKRRSRLCVGLDPDLSRIPEHLRKQHSVVDAIVSFNRTVIEATVDHVCAFKLNLAFFEVLGAGSFDCLTRTLEGIPPDVIVIADGKRGDIGNSAQFYASAAFESLRFDACTVSPYMGRDSVVPFLEFAGRCAFILVRTSNPGSIDFQTLDSNGIPLYSHVAQTALSWHTNKPGDIGFVIGATDPSAIRAVRKFAPNVPLLIPGIGSQGGDLENVLAAAGSGPILINSSRSILYASTGRDFAEAARKEADALRLRLGDS